ncbi:MAG: leucine-rich repeat domain-containing protein [Prosthecobacter sp.]|nr:leucine-rich repeat domain-containing protein [Prosthecobacter sp.]
MSPEDLPLVHQPGSSLVAVGPSGERIVAEMMSGALALSRLDAKAEAALVPRFKIGEHEFCEPDYRQILLWAESLDMEPETVLERLTEAPRFSDPWSFEPWQKCNSTKFENGRIVRLALNLESLPIREFTWVEGLGIEALIFILPQDHDSEDSHFNLHPLPLPKLERLFCHFLGLDRLDLSSVPQLFHLGCSGCHLRELDLSAVPKLEFLSCDHNEISSLNVGAAPCLQYLECRDNMLTELDLTAVPNLKELHCTGNQLTNLDLSSSFELGVLECSGNRLSALDVRHCHRLRSLGCEDNQLTALALPCFSQLTQLNCQNNELRELNVSEQPFLEAIWCEHNSIEELKVFDLLNLADLKYDKGKTRVNQRIDQDF